HPPGRCAPPAVGHRGGHRPGQGACPHDHAQPRRGALAVARPVRRSAGRGTRGERRMAAAIGTFGLELRLSGVALRFVSAALLLATGGWSLAALAREVPPPAYQLAAHRADVPARVLYAVALQE